MKARKEERTEEEERGEKRTWKGEIIKRGKGSKEGSGYTATCFHSHTPV
jgi:hypothetical protein